MLTDRVGEKFGVADKNGVRFALKTCIRIRDCLNVFVTDAPVSAFLP